MNLPEFLIDKLKLQYGQELTDEILNGYSRKRFKIKLNCEV